MVITRINNNITAINATRNLNSSSQALAKSLERLSSGLRINRAADDASGLSISERLRSQVRGLNRAISNAQDAINLVNTAEGALNETTAILQRIRELSVQAANSGGQDPASIQFAQDEIETAISEITRIAEQTQFSTRFLLNGDNASEASFSGPNLGASIVQGPVSSNLTEGDHFLAVTENTQANAVWSAGSDGTNNSNAIISSANAAASTFDTGALTLTVGNARNATSRVQESTAWTTGGNPITNTATTLSGTAVFNGVTLQDDYKIELTGTHADGSAATSVTLRVTNTNANSDVQTFAGFINAIGNFLDPTFSGPQYTGGAPTTANTDATATLDSSGKLVVTDIEAGTSQTSVTFTIKDGGGTTLVTESLGVTNAGNNNQAVVQLGDGPAQTVEAGNTYTLRGADPPPSDTTSPVPTLTMQFGSDPTATFTNGTDTITTTAGSYTATLDGGREVTFQNGDQNIRFFTGTQGGFDAGETVLLNFGNTVTAGTAVVGVDSDALSFQIGANAEQNVEIQIGNLRSTNLGYVGEYTVDGSKFKSDGSLVTSSDTGAVERTIQNLDVTTVEGANEAIRIVDQAISQVSAQRSALGAFTNRLESTVNNLGVASENLATSESRIRDADIAFETTQFTRNQILVSAGTSILAQANLAPQSVLQLLG